MADLPASGASLVDYQSYIKKALAERGFDEETVEQKFMLFAEEIGELAKAIRKHVGIKMADDTRRTQLRDEAGDVLILFLDLCNRLGISAEEALRVKESKNQEREWK